MTIVIIYDNFLIVILKYPTEEQILIFEGTFFRAEWYYTRDVSLPGYAYYTALDTVDRARFLQYVKTFCNNQPGVRLPTTMYNVEDKANKIYAFKPRDQRFFNFTTDQAKVIVTNGYQKHSQKMTKKDLENLAVSIKYKNDYHLRVKEGTYYESC